MALVPASSHGGSSATPALADVLSEGNDADDTGIDNLGDTSLSGNIATHGFDVRGIAAQDSPTLHLSGSQPGGATLTGGSSGAATTGGDAYIHGGHGNNFGVDGATVGVSGGNGDGVTPGKMFVSTNGHDGFSGEALVSDGLGYVDFGTLGSLKLDTHAAPADGDLAAGELRFWFDQTNGAPKLRAKAKQADGTVVTYTLAKD